MDSKKAKAFWMTYGSNGFTDSINHARSNAQTAAQKVCKGKIVIVEHSVEFVQSAIHFSHPDLSVSRILFRKKNANQLAEASV